MTFDVPPRPPSTLWPTTLVHCEQGCPPIYLNHLPPVSRSADGLLRLDQQLLGQHVRVRHRVMHRAE